MGEFILNGRNYGGSIITPNPSDTPTDTLDSVKIGDTTYEIQGGGGGRSSLILDAQRYSLDEQVVGIWTDGKPLYQRTWEFSSSVTLSAYTWFTTSIPNTGMEKIINVEAMSETGTRWAVSGACDEGSYVNLICFRNSTITVKYVTVRYTKTTDVAGSGGYQAYGFSPIIYSDTEREVGVWRDNKPLYQKTFYLASSSGVEDPLVADLSSLGIETIVSGNGMCLNVSNYVIPVNYAHQNSTYDVTWLVNDLKTRLELRLGSGQRTLHDIYVTLQYTKTTDVAGSGEYNTLAIPNVHYSTDEQVIGTWIDGKTLYQKTFTLASGSLSTGRLDIPNDLSDIDTVIDRKCTLYNTGASRSYDVPYMRATDNECIYLSLMVGSSKTVTAYLFVRSQSYASQVYSSLSNITLTLQYTKTT